MRRRFVSVVAFRYEDLSVEEKEREGYGLFVASMKSPDVWEAEVLPPEQSGREPLEVLALACCAGLTRQGDSRAPAETSVDEGLRILRRYNSDL